MSPTARGSRYNSDARLQKKEETKSRLIDAAEKWFAERGYDNVSVTDIASEAGVVPSLINTYFSGKAGLLYAVVQRHNAPQYDAVQRAGTSAGTAFERLNRIIAVEAEMDLARVNLLAALQALSWVWPPETEAKNMEELRPIRELLASVVRDGHQASEMRDIPVDDAVEMIMAIYTVGLRPAVFSGATAQDCAARIQTLVHHLLAP